MSVRALFGLFLAMLFVCEPVYARGVPKCGALDRGDLRDIYDVARDIRHYHDVRGDLDAACAALQRLKDWEKTLARGERHDRVYKNGRDQVISSVQSVMQRMRSPLKVMSVWLRVDYEDARGEAIRIARLRGLRKDVQSMQGQLRNAREQAIRFINDYNKKRAQAQKADPAR